MYYQYFDFSENNQVGKAIKILFLQITSKQ